MNQHLIGGPETQRRAPYLGGRGSGVGGGGVEHPTEIN
jgi:hypothetical protein